jgi:lipopolysaccharide export system permease protein
MRILTYYVLAEVMKVFLAALVILTLMMIMFGVIKEAREQGLELQQVIKIIPYILPDALRYTVPGTILFAVSSVYGRMSGSNEVVALKSLGISPWVVIWPVLVFAVVLSLVTVYLNDLAVSWGRSNVKRIVIESVEEIAYSMLRTQKSFSAPKFSMIVKGVQDKKLLAPDINFFGGGSEPSVHLKCEWAEMRSDLKEMVLTMVCHEGFIEVTGQGKMSFTKNPIERTIPLDSASPASDNVVLPAWLAMSVIPEHAAKQKVLVANYVRMRATKAASQILSGDFTQLNGPEAQSEAEALKSYRNHLARLLTEPYRRWSNGFSCLCFVLIGAPMAIWRRNADFLTNFFLCFLPILLVYYPLLAVGVDQAKAGKLPPSSVWLGNFILAGAGVWLFRKVFRY